MREVSADRARRRPSGTATRAAADRLREVLAGYLRRVRGAVADPERIVICAGFAQGFNLVLRVLAARGRRGLAFEDPGHPDDRANAERWGIEPITVPVDEHGHRRRRRWPRATRAGVLLTPAHQSPTGVVLAPTRRQALVELGRRRRRHDHRGRLRLRVSLRPRAGRRAPGSRAAPRGADRDRQQVAVARRSDSAGCCARRRCSRRSLTEKHKDDRGSPTLDQLALATLIESGRYDRHLRRMRGVYGGRRQALIDALARARPASHACRACRGHPRCRRAPGRRRRAGDRRAGPRALGRPLSDEPLPRRRTDRDRRSSRSASGT